MAVRARAVYLRNLVVAGHQARIHTSYNSATRAEKIKIVVEKGMSDGSRVVTLAALDALIAAIPACIATDRGHTNSAGATEVEFFLKPVGRANAAASAAQAAASDAPLGNGAADRAAFDEPEGPSNVEAEVSAVETEEEADEEKPEEVAIPASGTVSADTHPQHSGGEDAGATTEAQATEATAAASAAESEQRRK